MDEKEVKLAEYKGTKKFVVRKDGWVVVFSVKGASSFEGDLIPYSEVKKAIEESKKQGWLEG